MQFSCEIILMISNQTCATRSFDFEMRRMISDQIALHSVQLPLFMISVLAHIFWKQKYKNLKNNYS